MTWVKAKPGESIDNLLKRFKKAVENSGILADYRKHEVYEKPSVRRKRKQAAARKRMLKARKKTNKIKSKNENWKWNKDKTKKIPLKYSSSKFNNRFKKVQRNKTQTSNNRKIDKK